MKVLLLTGIREELEAVFNRIDFKYIRPDRIYQGINYKNLFASTVGPGFKKRKEIKKIINTIKPTFILNAGLVGILDERDSIVVGDLIDVSTLKNIHSKTVFKTDKHGSIMVTVDYPVFDPIERSELATKFDARLCDMESYYLASYLAENSEHFYSRDIKLLLCKVAGDRPEHFDLFQNEYLIRNWKTMSFAKKLVILMRFPGGVSSALKLLKLKKTALNSLGFHTERTLKEIFNSANKTDILHNTFNFVKQE